MIQVTLGGGQFIVAGSNWDSGSHLSFYASKVTEGEYAGESLDKHLTKEQIESIEAVIAAMVKTYIGGCDD